MSWASHIMPTYYTPSIRTTHVRIIMRGVPFVPAVECGILTNYAISHLGFLGTGHLSGPQADPGVNGDGLKCRHCDLCKSDHAML